jgi:vitamin B12 transporter
MWQLSPYASVILKNDEGLSVEAGLRWNHHSEYGNNFTYTFNPSYLINNKLKIFGNLYSAFKTPTLYQLFDPFSGNKNLEAERSVIVEGGAEYFFQPNFRARLVYFRRDTRDAIQFLLIDPGFFVYQYRNVNRQKSQGVEWETSYRSGRWEFGADYCFVSGKTTSGYDEAGNRRIKDTSYNNLYRVPKHAINFSVGMHTRGFFVKIQARTVSKRLEPVYAAAPKTLNGYYTMDFHIDYHVSKKWMVYLDLNNITNQRYFDIMGYNSRRFNFMTGISINL